MTCSAPLGWNPFGLIYDLRSSCLVLEFCPRAQWLVFSSSHYSAPNCTINVWNQPNSGETPPSPLKHRRPFRLQLPAGSLCTCVKFWTFYYRWFSFAFSSFIWGTCSVFSLTWKVSQYVMHYCFVSWRQLKPFKRFSPCCRYCLCQVYGSWSWIRFNRKTKHNNTTVY